MRRRFFSILSTLSFLFALVALGWGIRSVATTDHYIWDTSEGGTRLLRMSEGTIELYTFTTKLPPKIKRGVGSTMTNKRVIIDHDWDAVLLWGVRNHRAASDRLDDVWQTTWDKALGTEVWIMVLAFCAMPLWRLNNAWLKRKSTTPT